MTYGELPDLESGKINNLGSDKLQMRLDALYTMFRYGLSKGNCDSASGLDHRLSLKVLTEVWLKIHPGDGICRHNTQRPSSLLRSTKNGSGAAFALMLLLYVRFHNSSPLKVLDLNALYMAWLFAGNLIKRRGIKAEADINDLFSLAYDMRAEFREMPMSDFSEVCWNKKLHCFSARSGTSAAPQDAASPAMTLDAAERMAEGLRTPA